jgi:hypothetical protein
VASSDVSGPLLVELRSSLVAWGTLDFAAGTRRPRLPVRGEFEVVEHTRRLAGQPQSPHEFPVSSTDCPGQADWAVGALSEEVKIGFRCRVLPFMEMAHTADMTLDLKAVRRRGRHGQGRLQAGLYWSSR